MTDRSYGNLAEFVKFSNPAKPSYAECIVFFAHFLRKYPFLTDEDLSGLDRYFEYHELKKNDVLFLPGQVSTEMLFICKGAAKYYNENRNGKHIISFITEANFTAPANSFYHQTPCKNGAVCLEDTIGLSISHIKFKQLLEERPNFERAVLVHNQEIMAGLERRISTFQSLDALGRYELLMKKKPSLFHRFSLQDISNYLGIKPETLSRLPSDKSKRN